MRFVIVLVMLAVVATACGGGGLFCERENVISGYVKVGAVRISGATVMLDAAQTTTATAIALPALTITDNNGYYKFANVPNGWYVVTVVQFTHNNTSYSFNPQTVEMVNNDPVDHVNFDGLTHSQGGGGTI